MIIIHRIKYYIFIYDIFLCFDQNYCSFFILKIKFLIRIFVFVTTKISLSSFTKKIMEQPTSILINNTNENENKIDDNNDDDRNDNNNNNNKNKNKKAVTSLLSISAHETTPLPMSHAIKQNPVSPQAILDMYNANRSNDELFTIDESNLENDPKRIEARESFNATMQELETAAHQEKKLKIYINIIYVSYPCTFIYIYIYI